MNSGRSWCPRRRLNRRTEVVGAVTGRAAKPAMRGFCVAVYRRRAMADPTPIDIEFLDSHVDTTNWSVYNGEVLEIAGQEIRLRGYLIYEDDKWLVVALAVNDSGYSVGRMVVPKIAVTRRNDEEAN
jgi:hypothetical protein